MHRPLGVEGVAIAGAFSLVFVTAGPGARAQDAAGSPEDLAQQVERLLEAGAVEQAEAILREAVEKDPQDARLMRLWSRVLAEQGRDPEALRACERAVSLDPADPESRLWLAELYLRAEQPDSALEHYRIVEQARPNDPALKRQIAQILVWLDRNEEAIPYLEAYLAMVPAEVETLKTLYRLYLWTDQPDKALAMLEQVVERDPADRDANLELAQRYLDRDRVPDAIRVYQRMLQRNPVDAEAACALGTLYEWTDAARKALEAYERCLELRPFQEEARARALALSVELGRAREARTHARVLGVAGPAYDEAARRALLEDAGLGTALGVDFLWFNDRLGLHHIAVGPWGSYGLGDSVTVGARYRYHWLRGHPDLDGSLPAATVMGHEAGLFAEFKVHDQWTLDVSAAVTRYDSGWTSFNARAEQRADFDRLSLSFFLERADNLTTTGAVLDRVVFNTGGASLFVNPWRGLFVDLAAEGSYLNPDGNVRVYGWGAVGYRFLEMPHLEASYTYSIEHYRDNEEAGRVRSYFNPRAYQTHGPSASFRHPVTRWFLYGLDLRLWHAVRDDALLVTYGALLRFLPGVRHRLDLSYHRTDTLVGTGGGLYQENVLTASYGFEF